MLKGPASASASALEACVPQEGKDFMHNWLTGLKHLNPSIVGQLGSCFNDLFHRRTSSSDYPTNCYDINRAFHLPIIITGDNEGAFAEGFVITLGLRLGFATNLRVEQGGNGSNSFCRVVGADEFSPARPGTLYFNPSRFPSPAEHIQQLTEHRRAMSSRPTSELNATGTRYDVSMLFISFCMILHSLSIPFLLLSL